MIKCAVLGSPINHSLSPTIHLLAYEELGIDGTYEAIEINENNFHDFFTKAKEENWTGFSLTMPLKEVAAKAADETDQLALRIKSANTLLNINSKWIALSTDLLAFKSLIDIDSKAKVKVVGGGGTARAAIGALAATQPEVEVYIRSESRVEDLLSAAGGCKLIFKEMKDLTGSGDLIISTLPKHALDPYVDTFDKGSGTFLDVTYNPWPSKAAALWGGRVISGHELLVEQAMYQITFMTGEDFNYHLMRGKLLAAIK